MRLIISGGGTGGHIYPAIAICQKLEERVDDLDILYVGINGGPEEKISKSYGYKFQGLEGMGMQKKLGKKFFKSLHKNLKGYRQAGRIIKDYQPDIVVGTGGYVCGPILLKASKKGIPTLVHESNSYPGKTVKMLSKKVDLVCLSFSAAIKYLENKENIKVTGNPVRTNFDLSYTEEDLKKLGIDKDLPVVFSFGGSNGSYRLNEAIVGLSEKLDGKFYLLHQTGRRYYDDVKSRCKESPYLKLFPYIDDIDLFYGVSDLVIGSSGAMSLAEISSCEKPSILIPKGYTAENHQEYNARSYEKNGASLVILEKDLGPEILYDNIVDLVEDEDRLKLMGYNAGKMANPGACDEICNYIIELAGR